MKIKRLILTAVLLALVGITAGAADLYGYLLERATARTTDRYVGTNTSIAMRLKYVGGLIGSASVAVESNGDMTFLNAAGTADTDVVASTGVIDVSTTPFNTFGKIADVINKSTHWQCILVDVLPSWSCNDVMTAFTASATNLTANEGRALTYDTAQPANLGHGAVALGPEGFAYDFYPSYRKNLLNQRCTPLEAGGITWTNELYYLTATATFSAGTARLTVYDVDTDHVGANERVLWQQAGAATTVANTVDFTAIYSPDDGQVGCIRAAKGHRMVAVYDFLTTGTMTACVIQSHGLAIPNN